MALEYFRIRAKGSITVKGNYHNNLDNDAVNTVGGNDLTDGGNEAINRWN